MRTPAPLTLVILMTLVALVFVTAQPWEGNHGPRAMRDRAYRNDREGTLEARIEALRHRVAELTAENERLGAQLETEQYNDATIAKLQEQVRTLDFWLQKYKRRGLHDWTNSWTQKARGMKNGVVTEVRTLPGGGVIVGVSLGSEDGVKNGDVYHLRRGSAYVGQVTITKVYRSEAAGEFDTRYTGGATPPRKSDTAYPGN